MRTILLTGVLLLSAAGCDRREDPEVDRGSTAVDTPPGETVQATPETAPPSMPPPAVQPSCEGRAGSEGCPPADEQQVPTEPEPAQTPPEPR